MSTDKDRDDVANTLFGATEGPTAGENHSAGKPPEASDTQDRDAAETLFGTPEASTSYEAGLAGLLGPLGQEARESGDKDLLAEYTEFSQALPKALAHFQVSSQEARAFAWSLNHYSDSPLSEEALARRNDISMEELRRSWGEEADRMLEAARPVYRDLIQRVPGLKDFMELGAGSDPKVIEMLARIAKQRSKR